MKKLILSLSVSELFSIEFLFLIDVLQISGQTGYPMCSNLLFFLFCRRFRFGGLMRIRGLHEIQQGFGCGIGFFQKSHVSRMFQPYDLRFGVLGDHSFGGLRGNVSVLDRKSVV